MRVSYSDTSGTGLPINRLELLVDGVLSKAVDLPNLRTQGTYTFELDATPLAAHTVTRELRGVEGGVEGHIFFYHLSYGKDR